MTIIVIAVEHRSERRFYARQYSATSPQQLLPYKASNRLTQITHVEGVMNCRHIWAKGSVLSLLSPNTRFRTSVE